MKELKKFLHNINLKDFKHYLIISVVFIVALILISSFNFIQARYESRVTATSSPNVAFFIVDVGTQTGQIELENIVPNKEPYVYCFSVSNFNSERHADVDLKYNIEIITTTNLPLEYSVYSDEQLSNEILDQDIITTNDDGVFFKHLIIDQVNMMGYDDDVTDYYYLVVNYPISNKIFPEYYAGMIELIDIKINAEQDVSR